MSIIRDMARLGVRIIARHIFRSRPQSRRSEPQPKVPNRRRMTRLPVGLVAEIRRSDGTVIAARCVDANDETFSVHTETPFRVGESVSLTLGSSGRGPSFIAHVVWRRDACVGLRCTASTE